MRSSSRDARVVLYVIQSGGRNPWLTDIARLLDRGWTPVVASLEREGQLQADLRELGIDTVALDAGDRTRYPVALARLRRLMDRRSVDLLHALSFDCELLTMLACAPPSGPSWVYTYFHQPHFFEDVRTSWWKRRSLLFLDRLIARRADAIVSPSRPVRDALEADRIDRRKIRDVPVGLDRDALTARAMATVQPARDEFAADSSFLAVCVARLSWEKGHSRLLRGWAEVVAEQPRARLVLVGVGPLRERLEALAAELGIAANVVFAGYRSDVPGVMAAADAVVHFATHESFGQVLAEALALGRPLITTPVGIGAELVDEVDCLVIRHDDPHGLSLAVRRLAREPDLARRLTDAGKRRAARDLPIERNVRSFESIYEEVLSWKKRV